MAKIAIGARPAVRKRSLLGRVARLVGFTLGSLVLCVWGLGPVVFVHNMLHPVRTPVQHTASNLPFPAEDVAFPARSGATIRGWLSRGAAGAPAILLSHGFSCNREQMLIQAGFLHEAGYTVLLFDWDGQGTSDGSQVYFGGHEVGDVQGALDYLAGRADLGLSRFGGLGVSYGSAMMLMAAAADHRLRAVVSDSVYVYSSFQHQFDTWHHDGLTMAGYTIPVAPLFDPAARFMLGHNLSDLDPLRAAPAVSPSALLLIHSEHDSYPFTPLSGAKQVYAAAQEPKALWISPLGDHATAVLDNPVDYRRHVLDFFARYLPVQ